MFTVILLSQAAKTIYPRAKAFFDPFVDDGRIAFCEWNESDRACTLAQAIPELPEVIRGKGAWRAIVVDHSARSADAHRHPQNPFDFTDNTAFALNLQDSPHALVRVSHALLGYPAMSARSFEPVITYRGDDGGRVHEAVSMGEGWRARLTELSRVASDVRVDYRAVPYSDDEHAVHAALTERYRVRETKPAEVVFVSTRAHVDLDDRTLLAQAWRTESEQNVSRFVERNDYPPTTRFAVYDLLNPENSGYEQDELRFWLSILTVAVNELPPSAFQGDRLYQLGIEFSDADLADQLNEHMSRLTALREHLDAYLDRTPRAPETQVRDILAEETVLVEFDKLGGEELVVDTAGYGFARDAPRDEAERWAADFQRVYDAAQHFMRRPRRVLARAVYESRAQSRHRSEDPRLLSGIERDELVEELAGRVGALTAPATTEILDRDRLSRMLAQQNRAVRTHIAGRMRRRTIVAASAGVLAIWVAAFVPYVLQGLRTGGAAPAASLGVVAGVVLLLAAVGAMTLWVMRRRLLLLIGGVNDALRTFAAGVAGGAAAFGGYLSELATYRRAQAALIDSERLEQRRRDGNRRLAVVRASARAVIDAERMIVESLGRPVEVRKAAAALVGVDLDDDRRVAAFFHLETSDRVAAFNHSGERVAAPYDFVRRLRVERIALFEERGGEPA